MSVLLSRVLRRSPVPSAIRIERRRGQTRITCVLERLTCQNVEPLYRVLRRCHHHAPPTIIVDLAQARYVDTTVLAVLIDVKARLAVLRPDTRLVVRGSPAYRRLVCVCRLESLLPRP